MQIYVVFSVMGGHNAKLTPSLRNEWSLEWNVNEQTIYKKITPTHDMGLHDTEWNPESGNLVTTPLPQSTTSEDHACGRGARA